MEKCEGRRRWKGACREYWEIVGKVEGLLGYEPGQLSLSGIVKTELGEQVT